jgi:hypothetical protein
LRGTPLLAAEYRTKIKTVRPVKAGFDKIGLLVRVTLFFSLKYNLQSFVQGDVSINY